jgi:hypothetical protein
VLRRLMPGQMWRWYAHDVALPVGTALAVCFAFRLALAPPAGWFASAGYLASAGVLSLLAAAWTSPACRSFARGVFRRLFRTALPEGVSSAS